ncbi:hypothetical protein HC031_12980 [Planosporangium thailandense]|uniref:Uncharacterized protein n=1 Tax=Planosporangium thailandense TaxID=765197 RepID=A0ABX0XX62_9ACTN|nr:hypothetical protein [Planosporangium thailandense]NJC70620.1 hypothetical protein [Planosporangium thailandense]
MRRWETLIDYALWIRAAERIEVPAGGLVPGPVDLDPLPPSTPSAGGALGGQWADWWGSLVDTPRRHPPVPPDPVPEPAYDTPDPLGLAQRPALAEVVARRWREAHAWHTAREAAGMARHVPPSAIEGQIVRDVERAAGRRIRPFDVEFILLPVRDDVIRRVHDRRYLVPEGVYDGPRWATWLHALVSRIG